MERRQVLVSAAAVGSAAFVGSVRSAEAQSGSGIGSEADPEPPSVPVEEFDGGWELDRERSGTFSDSAAGVTTRGTTAAYVDEALSEAVEERTLGTEVRDLRVFFATRIEYAPAIDDLPFGVGRAAVLNATASNARERFEDRLAGGGLEAVERRGTGSLGIDDGSTAELVAYDAVYPFEGFEFEAGDSVVDIEGRPLSVEGMLAVWYSEPSGSTLVAGAIHPAEDYEQTVERELTDAIELTLEIDLGLEPGAYREESVALVRAVS